MIIPIGNRGFQRFTALTSKPRLGGAMVHALGIAAATGVHHMHQAVSIDQVVEEGVATATAQISAFGKQSPWEKWEKI